MRHLSEDRRALIPLGLSMVIFGTISVFVRGIPLSSSAIALVRGLLGALFLLLVSIVRKSPVSLASIRRNLPILCLSGASLGLNWALLFEAYRYTTVATATLCYYLAPVFVILASPLALKERISARKWICVAAALAGMTLVSGVLPAGAAEAPNGRGALLGLGAAVFYACVVLTTKKLTDISAYDGTMVQLAVSAGVMLPYTLLTGGFKTAALTPLALLLLGMVGILHTGVAYLLYFGSVKRLPAQTAAIFSYIDPVVAILISAFFLGETLSGAGVAGAALILGATCVAQLPNGTFIRRKNTPNEERMGSK